MFCDIVVAQLGPLNLAGCLTAKTSLSTLIAWPQYISTSQLAHHFFNVNLSILSLERDETGPRPGGTYLTTHAAFGII